ncbi:MAG: TRAP transporter small permease subunit, partial [Rhizobiaceae bacterium]
MAAHGVTNGDDTPSVDIQNSNVFIRTVNNISSLCGVVAAGLIVIAVGITCQMIFVRFVLNQSTIWQTEAVVYMMVGATLIGLPYVQRWRGHVNVDLFPLMLPQRARYWLALLV